MIILNKKAFSVVEYAVLIVIIITGLLLMQNYMQRGIYGGWQQAGQSFAFGRQYDAQKSIECDYSGTFWYDRNCFDRAMGQSQCVAGTSCEAPLMSGCQGSCSQVAQ